MPAKTTSRPARNASKSSPARAKTGKSTTATGRPVSGIARKDTAAQSSRKSERPHAAMVIGEGGLQSGGATDGKLVFQQIPDKAPRAPDVEVRDD